MREKLTFGWRCLSFVRSLIGIGNFCRFSYSRSAPFHAIHRSMRFVHYFQYFSSCLKDEHSLLFKRETGTQTIKRISGTNSNSFCIAFAIFSAKDWTDWMQCIECRISRCYRNQENAGFFFSRKFFAPIYWMFRLFFSMYNVTLLESNSVRAFKRLNTVKFAVVNLISAAHLGNRFKLMHRIVFQCICYCLWHQLVAYTPIQAKLTLSMHIKSIWNWCASMQFTNAFQ